MTNKFLLDLTRPIFSNSFIGFDRLFSDLYEMQRLAEIEKTGMTNYPPYNMTKKDNTYKLSMAVAGIPKKDISIVKEKNVLTVYGTTENKEKEDTLYHGIATRNFKKSFNVAEDIEIKDATLKDGMLTIEMERLVPEEDKPVTIKIK